MTAAEQRPEISGGKEIMAQKKKEKATVLSQKTLAPGIYDAVLRTSIAKDAVPGQFIAVYPKDKSTLLPRPISICEVNKEESTLRIVYRVAGKGTVSSLSGQKAKKFMYWVYLETDSRWMQ